MVLPLMSIISGATALAQGIMGANANSQNQAIAQANLNEQRRVNAENEKLAKADRQDAYGNIVKYIDGLGFRTELTPLTKAILNAQQSEQLRSFREDAPRQRAAAERLDRRSRKADEVYREKFNDYRYSREKSEKEFMAEAIRDALIARSGDRSKNNGLARAALRTNNVAAIPEIAKAANSGRETLAEAIMGAKQRGKQQYLVENNARTQSKMGELQQLKSIADQFIPTQLNYNNENNALSGRADNALQTLINANMQGTQAVGNAYKSIPASQPFNLNSVTPLMEALINIQNTNVDNGSKKRNISAWRSNSGDF